MSNIKYSVIQTEDWSTISVIVDGEVYTATDTSHSNFDKIVEAARAGNPNVVNLFDLAAGAAKKFAEVTDRVTLVGNALHLDGEAIDNALSQKILEFMNEGLDFRPLVRFMINIADNPNAHSRKQLFDWMGAGHVTITEDGDIVAYKGVQSNLNSAHAGHGIVNGEVMNGYLPNLPGNIIEMDRGDVTFDPNSHCSTGLHVGTWSYASTFSQRTLEVHVNPSDVVSVPNDASYQKMRVCRYRVVGDISQPYTDVVIPAEAPAPVEEPSLTTF